MRTNQQRQSIIGTKTQRAFPRTADYCTWISLSYCRHMPTWSKLPVLGIFSNLCSNEGKCHPVKRGMCLSVLFEICMKRPFK